MADDVEEPTGAAAEAPDAPEAPQPHDTDVSDLPLDESPEAHIRRALAGDVGDGEAGDAAPAADEAPAADAAPAAPAAEAGGEAAPAGE